ncbi:MAG TPA: hypothetical protein VLA52_00670 [Thermohalobaculum sp.]|nr:hypothetical protein [Thermohalobaculum sp.]
MAALAVLALSCASPHAQTGENAPVPLLPASNGVMVPMPEIAGLECRDMASALRRIDQSRYREAAVVPPGHPDRPIFDYEHRLARAYYNGCLARNHALEDPAAVFTFGFQTQ